MRASRRREWAGPLAMLVSLSALGGGGCPAFFIHQDPDTADPSSADEGALPESAAECRALAERVGVEGASAAEQRLALRAIERVETLEGESVELAIDEARLVARIAESMGKTSKAVRWLDRGDVLAGRIHGEAPDRVEAHYYKAVFLGLRAQIQAVGGLDLVPEVLTAARRAVEIDETFDDAAPLAILGSLLVKAPAWPHGVGDPEGGLEILERATKLSDYPVNRMLYGAALIEDGQKARGCRELARVLAAPKRGRWAKTGSRYRVETRLLIRASRCPTSPRRPGQ